MISRDSTVDVKIGTPLALGATVGGVLGKQIFTLAKNISGSPDVVGGIQAMCLAIITLGTLLYSCNKSRFHTKHIRSIMPCTAIGLILGILSSFLGIGGGPINLVVLFYFFSMDTKTAAANSLYIILFSQIASLVTTLITHTVPAFDSFILILMVAGGIGGGIAGRVVNRHILSATVDRLFIGLMVLIIGISIYNIWRFWG